MSSGRLPSNVRYGRSHQRYLEPREYDETPGPLRRSDLRVLRMVPAAVVVVAVGWFFVSLAILVLGGPMGNGATP